VTPILIHGFLRSGTTALYRSIHKVAPALTYEWNIMDKFSKYDIISTKKKLCEHLTNIKGTYHQMNTNLDGIIDAITKLDANNSTSLLTKMYEKIAKINKSPIWGDKTPNWINMDIVLRRWPNIKIIFIYRNGLDAVASAAWRKLCPSIDEGLRRWTNNILSWIKWSKNAKYLLNIKQEEMLVKPDKIHNQLSNFIGISIDRSEIHKVLYHNTPTGAGPNGIIEAKHKLSHVGRWKRECPNIIIKSKTKECLHRLGYHIPHSQTL